MASTHRLGTMAGTLRCHHSTTRCGVILATRGTIGIGTSATIRGTTTLGSTLATTLVTIHIQATTIHIIHHTTVHSQACSQAIDQSRVAEHRRVAL